MKLLLSIGKGTLKHALGDISNLCSNIWPGHQPLGVSIAPALKPALGAEGAGGWGWQAAKLATGLSCLGPALRKLFLQFCPVLNYLWK